MGAALATLLLSACGPENPSNPCAELGDQCGERTLGEMVYWILEERLADAETCAEQYVSEFSAHEEAFVSTFDDAITANLVANEGALEDLIGNALEPLVEDGRLPALTDALAEALTLLVDDPEREALHAFDDLANTRSVLEAEMLLALARAVIDDPAVDAQLHALASLANEHDGVDHFLDSALQVAASSARTENEDPSACPSVEMPPLEQTLLSEEGHAEISSAARAWVARPDDHGNPRIDLGTRQTMPAPFVDGDGDGDADLDADGRPVDASGLPIDLPSLADGPIERGDGVTPVDPRGFPLADDGEPYFVYYDASRTTLAHLLRWARLAVAEGVHRDAIVVADAVLGEAEVCHDGTPGCRRYPASDHSVADLAYAILEMGKFEGAAELLSAAASILEHDPALAEALLAAMAQVVVELESSPLSLRDETLLATLADFVPLIDSIFVAPSAGGEPTARLLMRTAIEVGRSPEPLHLDKLVGYRRVLRDPLCSATPPSVDAADAVRFDRPRWDQGVDNRSVLEQLLELFAAADSCTQNLSITLEDGTEISGSVAYIALYQLADKQPGEACGVASNLLLTIEELGSAFGEENLEVILESLLGCPDGAALRGELEALQSLAASGAMDGVLPLARVFRDQGELNTLIELVHVLATDLHAEDAGGESAIRSMLEVFAALLETDAGDALLDAMVLLDGEPAPTGGGATLADVFIDTMAHGVRHRAFVYDRRQTVANTSHAERVMAHARALVVRVNAAGDAAEGSFDRLVDFVTGRLALDASSAEPRLADAELRPTVAHLSRMLAELVALNQGEYGCALAELQRDTVDLLLGRDFATLVRLARTFAVSPHGRPLEAWLVSALDPEGRVAAPLLQSLAAALSTDVADASLSAILDYLEQVAALRQDDGRELIGTLDALVTGDESGAVLDIVRDIIAPSETGGTRLGVFVDAYTGVSAVREFGSSRGGVCEVSEADLGVESVAELLEEAAGFLHSSSEDYGLGLIYDLLE